MKKNILGALVGGLTLFGTGAIIYLLLFPQPAYLIEKGVDSCLREQEVIPLIITMEIIFGLLLTIIFNRWAGITNPQSGLAAGAGIGLLLGLTIGMWEYSTTTIFTVYVIPFYALPVPKR